MPNSKYVIIYPYKFTQRDWDRFGCDRARARGFDVWIIQCANILGIDDTHIQSNPIDGARHMESVNSVAELRGVLKNLDKRDLIISLIKMDVGVEVYKELKHADLDYIWCSHSNIAQSYLPDYRATKSLFELIIFAKDVFGGLLYRIKQRMKLIRALGISYWSLPAPLFVAKVGRANKFLQELVPGYWRSPVLYVQSSDHLMCSQAEAVPVGNKRKKTAVFIDQALPKHPDFKLNAKASISDEATYYGSLRNFFDRLENDLSIDVVVTAHPRVKYTETEKIELFGGRKVIEGNTFQVVRESDLILTHLSTAISYAVASRKPIMILTTDILEKTFYWNYLVSTSSCLGLRRINMDEVVRNECRLQMPKVDMKAYERYEDNFLCARNARRGNMWDVLIDRFEEMSIERGFNSDR